MSNESKKLMSGGIIHNNSDTIRAMADNTDYLTNKQWDAISEVVNGQYSEQEDKIITIKFSRLDRIKMRLAMRKIKIISRPLNK